MTDTHGCQEMPEDEASALRSELESIRADREHLVRQIRQSERAHEDLVRQINRSQEAIERSKELIRRIDEMLSRAGEKP